MASWSYVGVGAGTSPTSGNVTPTEPTGAAQGDLLVCVISYRSSAAFTAPAGWTIVQQESSGNTDVDVSTSIASGLIAYIVRGASAPSYTFTRTGGDIAIARVVAYTPVGGTITFDESNSATLGSASTTVSMTGLTTNAADSLIVVGACGASNSTATAFVAATDPSTGSGASSTTTAGTIVSGTWRRRNSTGSTNGADTNISIADAVRATAGATGDIQYTAAASRCHVIVGAAFTLTPSGATLTADAGSFALTGVAAGLGLTRTIAGDVGSCALTGNATGLTTSRVLTASAGAFTQTGVDAGLSAGNNLTASAQSFALSGIAAGLLRQSTLTASGGSFTLTGNTTGLSRVQVLVASGGAFTFTGVAAGLNASRVLGAGTGAFTLTGIDAGLTPITSLSTLTAAAGAFTLAGVAAGLTISRQIVAEPGAFTFAGQSVNLRIGGRGLGARSIALPRADRIAHLIERPRVVSIPRPDRTVHIL